jgi:hypothetical protein
MRRVSAPGAAAVAGAEAADVLRCVICRRPFAFAAGEAAVVLRHTAYGHDFAHEGPCLAAARALLFLEPGYDRAAFGRDPERRLVLAAAPAARWTAVLAAPTGGFAGPAVRLEPLRWWALVEFRDGTRRVEGLARDDAWRDEPGGAEFPAAAGGGRALIAYAPPGTAASPARLAAWEARARARYRGVRLPNELDDAGDAGESQAPPIRLAA